MTNPTQENKMTAQTIDQTTIDNLVASYVSLTDQINQLTDALDGIKSQLRDLGPGEYRSSSGVTASVSAPSRRFDINTAWSLLTPEQQAVCVAPDASKVKSQLPEILLEQCYAAGAGAPRVVVR